MSCLGTVNDLSDSRTADDTRAEATHTAKNVRYTVVHAAEHAKEIINQGLDNLKHKANDQFSL